MKYLVLLTLIPIIFTCNPIIGIIALPSEYDEYDKNTFNQLPASYVKWIENAGGRVIPIPYNQPMETIKDLLTKVNGLLIPGGFHHIYNHDKQLSDVTTRIKTILQEVADFKNNHFTMPVFAIQNGMNHLVAIIENLYPGSIDVFRYYKANDLTANIKFTFNETSRMWNLQQKRTMEYVQAQNSTYYHHNSSLSVQGFLYNQFFRGNFDITAQSLDRLGWWLVAGIEGKQWPIYATQFFPNAPSFEWNQNISVPHFRESIKFGNDLGLFFVNEARKQEEIKVNVKHLLVYNYERKLVHNSGFSDEVYFIK